MRLPGKLRELLGSPENKSHDQKISRREFGKLLGTGSAIGAGTLLFSDSVSSTTGIGTDYISLDDGTDLKFGSGDDFELRYDSVSSQLELVGSNTVFSVSSNGSLNIQNRDLDLGSGNITGVSNVDGVDVSSHASNSSAHHSRPSAGQNMNEDDSGNFDVTPSSIDATSLDGSSGTSGQVLQTDGSNISWGSSGGGSINPGTVGTILRGAIRDKQRDLSDGDTPIVYPTTWVEIFSSSNGDNSTVDGTNTDAVYSPVDNQGNLFECKTSTTSSLDEFNDGSIDSNIWTITENSNTNDAYAQSSGTSESSGELTTNLYIDGIPDFTQNNIKRTNKAEFQTSGIKKIEFEVNSSDIRAVIEGSSNATDFQVQSIFRIRLVDDTGGSEQILYQKAEENRVGYNSSTTSDSNNLKTGLWRIKQKSDGTAELVDPDGTVKGTASAGIPADASIEFEHYVELDSNGDGSSDGQAYCDTKMDYIRAVDAIYEASTVQSDVILSKKSNITKAYIDMIASYEGDSSISIDISTDGGSNFDKTDVGSRSLVDLSSIASPGQNLVIRFNLQPSTDTTGTPTLENYSAKVWTQ